MLWSLPRDTDECLEHPGERAVSLLSVGGQRIPLCASCSRYASRTVPPRKSRAYLDVLDALARRVGVDLRSIREAPTHCDCGSPVRAPGRWDCLACAQRTCEAGAAAGVSYEPLGAHAVARPYERADCEACGGCRALDFVEVHGGREYRMVRDCPAASAAGNVDAYNAARVPGNHAGSSFASYRDRPEWPALAKVRDRCERWAQEARPGERGVLLAGPHGTGKTHLLAAMTRVLTVERGIRVRFASWPSVVSALRDTFGGQGKARDVLRPLRDATVLVLDEIGMQLDRSWQSDEMDDLLDHRYRSPETTTIGATNLHGAELERAIGPRAASRLLELVRVEAMQATDYRPGVRR